MCGEGCPARSAQGLVAAISRSVAARVFLPAVLGYWRVVGEGFPPSFFVAVGRFLGYGEAKGGGVGRAFSFFFCVKGAVDCGC